MGTMRRSGPAKKKKVKRKGEWKSLFYCRRQMGGQRHQQIIQGPGMTGTNHSKMRSIGFLLFIGGKDAGWARGVNAISKRAMQIQARRQSEWGRRVPLAEGIEEAAYCAPWKPGSRETKGGSSGRKKAASETSVSKMETRTPGGKTRMDSYPVEEKVGFGSENMD